jgi:hypothetical protein
MSGRTSLLPVTAVVLLLAACHDSGITDPSLRSDVQLQAKSGAAASVDAMVPIKWTYHVTAIDDGELLECTLPDGSPTGIRSPANWAVAAGMMSHLGILDTQASYAGFTSCVVNIVGGYPLTADADAFVHLVGANGDAVDLSGVLTLSFVENNATGDWTITGGSGRFTGAHGWLKTLEVPAADGSGSVGSGSGMITPPGALGH